MAAPSPKSADPIRITGPLPAGLKLLSPEQRAAYERDGFLAVEGLVEADWLGRLRKATAEFVEKSRALSESNVIFDLETDHSAERPRLRRLVSPVDLHPTFWEFGRES